MFGDLTTTDLLNTVERSLSSTFTDDDRPEYETVQHDTRIEIPVRSLDGALLEIQPYEDNPGIEAAANLLQSLHGVRIRNSSNVSSAHSFEVWYDPRTGGEAGFNFRLFAANPRAKERFQRKVEASYPNTGVEAIEEGHALPPIERGHHVSAANLRLKKHTFHPIRHYSTSEGFPHGDPYGDVLREMLTIEDSITVLQVVFKPASGQWYENGPDGRSIAQISDEIMEGDVESLSSLSSWWHYFADGELEVREPQEKDKQAAKIVENQRGEQAFHANIRILTASHDPLEAMERAYGIGDIFSKYYNTPVEQGFNHIPVSPDRLPRIYREMVERYYNDGVDDMVLTTDELAGVAHIPDKSTSLPEMPFKKTQSGGQISSQVEAYEPDTNQQQPASQSARDAPAESSGSAPKPTRDGREAVRGDPDPGPSTTTSPDGDIPSFIDAYDDPDDHREDDTETTPSDRLRTGDGMGAELGDESPPASPSTPEEPTSSTPATDTPPTTPPQQPHSGAASEPSPSERASNATHDPASTGSEPTGLICNPDAFTEGSVGEGVWTETPQINRDRAAAIADEAHDEWDGEGHPGEQYLRMAARGHLPGVSEAETIQGQPAEMAVVDQYNKRYDPPEPRRANTDCFDYY